MISRLAKLTMLVALGSLAHGDDQMPIDEFIDEFRERLSTIENPEFSAIRELGDQWRSRTSTVDFSQNKHLLDDCEGIAGTLSDMTVERFAVVVEEQATEEAIEAFTHYGNSKIKARLIGVLDGEDDLEFVARLLHADLQESVRAKHLGRFSLSSVGEFNALYHKVLGTPELTVAEPVTGSCKEAELLPFRRNLEKIYPVLAEASEDDRPPPSLTKDSQASQSDPPRTRPSDPPGEGPDRESRRFPMLPVLAGGALVVLLIAWLIGRASRRH